jgi:putative restriction endonuclease
MKNYAFENRKELEKSNYVRIASPNTNYWVDFRLSKIKEYESKFGEEFNLIIIGDENIEGDFYIIPYWLAKSVFTEQSLYETPRQRWIASVNFHQLSVRKNHQAIDIGGYYGVFEFPKLNDDKLEEFHEQQADYAIENRKLEINARQKQSVFRTKVLHNFEHQCCLSDTVEEDLLVASHIIPWAERIQTRLDPANGLCLSYAYDRLFDQGYFSLERNYQVTITDKASELSQSVQKTLLSIEGQKIREPRIYPISPDYIEYHRIYIFKK